MAIEDGLGRDAMQSLLEMAYQKQQAGLRAGIHEHECHACSKVLSCCCGDRRKMDRMTGKRRVFWCLECAEFKGAFDKVNAQIDLEQFT
jgi:RNase P subunit RPR2